MSDDLRLNSIDRFQKKSERLVLQEHSSCEVPAGCGGVVLRWVNLNAGAPLVMRSGFAEEIEVFVDDTPTASGRMTVAFGEHVLAVRATFNEDSLSAFWLAAERDVPGEHVVIEGLVTAADGTWRATYSEPPEDWWAADFDDAAWTPLEASPIDADSLDDELQWQWHRMAELNAAALDVNGPGEIWIRKHFSLER